MPGTDKVLGEGAMTTEGLLFEDNSPQEASPPMLSSHLSPMAFQQPAPALRPQPARTRMPQSLRDAQPFGENQCHCQRAAGLSFLGLHGIPATTRTSPCLRLLRRHRTDTRAQTVSAQKPWGLQPLPGSGGLSRAQVSWELTFWTRGRPPVGKAKKGV
jgi:hypothetical protein